MKLLHLRCIIAAAEECNVTRAARRLHIARPTAAEDHSPLRDKNSSVEFSPRELSTMDLIKALKDERIDATAL